MPSLVDVDKRSETAELRNKNRKETIRRAGSTGPDDTAARLDDTVESTLQQLRELFDEADTDGSGELDREELARLIKNYLTQQVEPQQPLGLARSPVLYPGGVSLQNKSPGASRQALAAVRHRRAGGAAIPRVHRVVI